MTPSQQFADFQVIRTILLQAVATYMLREIINRLQKLEKEVLSALLESDLDGTASASAQRKAFKEFQASVDERITAAYRELNSRIEDDFDVIAKKEDEKQRDMILLLFGFKLAAQNTNGRRVNILGAPVQNWMGRQAGDLQFRLEQAIRNGLNAGEDQTRLRRRIRGHAGTGENAEAVALPRVFTPIERAAEQTIRTGVEAVAQDVLTGLGETVPASIRIGWQQISVLDARTTNICRAYAFKIWNRNYQPIGHNLPFAGGVPRHINCLTGDALVSPVGKITSVSKRWYQGKMVTFQTTSGYKLTCTPNHPVLTDSGWVAAKFLNQSSRVICDSVVKFPVVNKTESQNRVTTIKEIVESLLVSDQFISVEMPTSAPDFHGDVSGSEVAIIGTDRSLTIKRDAALCHHVEKLPLITGATNGIHARNGTLTKLANAGFSTTHRVMGGSRESKTGALASPLHSSELLLTPVSYRDTSLDKSFHNRGMGNSEFSGNPVDTDTRSIKFENLVCVENDSFHGFVYNIETEANYYFANGVATHNCRSRIVLYLFEDGPTNEFTFRQWMDRLTPEEQKQIFGRVRLKMWRDGKITDQDLIRSQERAIAPENLNND